MIELLGSIGWGLLAVGAITHVWHHATLRSLLAMHFDHERIPAAALTALEALLAVSLPIALLAESTTLPWLAASALVLALGFMAWIARLLLTGSALPCACSFSDAPTTWWSFLRASCAALVGLLAVASPSDDTGITVATLTVGAAIAAGIFVLPEAITWPVTSKALMERVDAHTSELAA